MSAIHLGATSPSRSHPSSATRSMEYSSSTPPRQPGTRCCAPFPTTARPPQRASHRCVRCRQLRPTTQKESTGLSAFAELAEIAIARLAAADRRHRRRPRVRRPRRQPRTRRPTADNWNTGQRHWVSLSSHGELVEVPDTGHYIHIDQPTSSSSRSPRCSPDTTRPTRQPLKITEEHMNTAQTNRQRLITAWTEERHASTEAIRRTTCATSVGSSRTSPHPQPADGRTPCPHPRRDAAVRSPHPSTSRAVGQLFRTLVAAPGSWSGRYPVGNTGGANVSAFAEMDVPADLQGLLETVS